MTIDEAIAKAQRFLGDLPAPKNEANTCDWIVRPLVEAAGYDSHEVHSQLTDGASGRPDYVVLPDTEHTWYVEAKAWSVALDSTHATQALNYAYANGRRWVVLTNGQEWRLYDAHIQGRSDDRLVTTAKLKDAESLRTFLNALSKDGLASGQIAEYAATKRLVDYLQAALRDPSSSVLQAIVRTAQAALGVKVTPQSVIQALQPPKAALPPVTLPPAAVTIPPPKSDPVPGHQDNRFSTNYKGLHAIAQFHGKAMTILPGSQLTKTPQNSSRTWYEAKIAKLLAHGQIAERPDHYEVLQPIETGSPSGASDLVYGAATNGWVEWRNVGGKTLDDLFRKHSAGGV